ncbi:methylated-DNA-protein-cysteine methyltransferase related protein [Pelagirhabdus alkalitolerans]|uniref:Methylated-DNA-protein-cysteine methyltransferase related protein n=1 Tax=Pelagirhabdus alkalitolerans TaxID=1612202 RepID=A0A1G6GRF0_9BACI|nr:methylated-DNA--[protein]-cysteine S-methyltransferase [Pelagirhabdus alkalitolerans]SDB84423.1 methylated-DNA-protein-cysteine methyltransferase related protein [Pelagirhabdus alkalitolerans]
MTPFTENVIAIIKSIPYGDVRSYGSIAKEAGHPRAARQVSRILHSMSASHDLPWHRVVNKNHQVTIKDKEARFMQIHYLREEGVEVTDQGSVIQ